MDRDEKIEQLLIEIRDNQQRQIDLSQQSLNSYTRYRRGINTWLIPLFIILVLMALWTFLLPFLATPTP